MCQLGIIILKIKQNKTAISYELISNLFSYFFSGLKPPSKKSKGHKAGISRWWSFRRKKPTSIFYISAEKFTFYSKKMVANCGATCAKYLLCLFNFTFFVSSFTTMESDSLWSRIGFFMHKIFIRMFLKVLFIVRYSKRQITALIFLPITKQ